MSVELYRRARRAEARSARAPERRRLRLEFFRQALAEGYDSLKVRHAEGASGQESVRTHARLMDDVIFSLTRLIAADAAADGLEATPLVVMALGGYGRGELHPLSDVDLMVVYDGEMSPYVQRMMQELLYSLWDLGLHVGHSLRSLDDCVAMARTDFPSRTSMQEARFLAGERRLFARFQRVLRENVFRRDFGQFLETTLVERDARYRKHGASPYIGEPNVKESAGGLRDMHTAMWLGAAKFGARTLRELTDKGLITPREQAAADAALTFLWRVRNELHFFSGHKNDVLTRDLQPRIAKNLGYENDETTLGVERFMRDYYLHARVIHRVSKRLIARCQETLSRRGSAERRQRQQALADGLVFFDGRLHLADRDPSQLRTDPARLMKVFWHLHRLGCELSLDLERAIEDSLHLVDEAFRRSDGVRELFLDVCRTWGRAAQTFSEMHELGFLGRYLPEFGALTCLVQYDVYHKFSADQHSLLAVEHLEALAPGQSAESEGAAHVLSEVEKPELLMLGMLLHDIGKAKGHGHVAKGIPLVRELTARVGLQAADGAAVEFLVAHHLTMSHVAQRRDIDDPKTITDFAAAVGDPSRLRMLYLLTYADMRAVGPGVLTPWQARILHELYARTLASLTGGRVARPSRTRLAERLHAAAKGEVDLQAVKAHLAMMTDRYLESTSVQRMAEHLRMLDGLGESPVVTALFHHPDLGSSDLVVVTRDLPGLFALIAGTLAASDANIISAQIHTRADGIAIDTFQVNDPAGDVIGSPAHWARTLDALRAVLTGEQTVPALLARRRAAGREATGPGGPSKIALDNQLSDTATVIEVKCPDRLGLLYLITKTLAGLGLDIVSARIATEIDQAFDTFYVQDREGRKIEDPETLERARAGLEQALAQPI
ncbi:MAG: [protein-PII] uridylyltransferase [Candidatus Rokubacteria bacterium 13_1_40CM_4_69_39]|nr:MAG: [protein-PII] uridylyltransferase [Candidatus Rokubacteria bacterium 13_2_20CM_70_12]OLC51550.1 MAG: [protein-PII] uridylyltransferase [Candidatus Rokubacteria bacterium 13_1_40CM_4_69_39]OLC92326.1 MAG: [protein-PII] uridylyltransferase [Candidatus Rokubacteria bacterium 13_1_40CM_3_69_38]OLD24407.1 MAG: [protein-PII] uridylyltransferase [Candidatus Rokubacteria bacterium 13_1_40CM_2_70_45]OLD75172.1 MAG: [protein-PII] uridylyltransferase [Candidatus Rokubacteria bacterium 13_1_20CM_4_